MPELQRVYDKTRDSGVQFLGIDIRDGIRSAPQDFVRNLGITYPSIYDPPGRSLLALQGFPRSVVPATLVLDRRHRVAAVFLEQLSESELLPAVRRIAAGLHFDRSMSDRRVTPGSAAEPPADWYSVARFEGAGYRPPDLIWCPEDRWLGQPLD